MRRETETADERLARADARRGRRRIDVTGILE
jgi:hypothetical protein